MKRSTVELLREVFADIHALYSGEITPDEYNVRIKERWDKQPNLFNHEGEEVQP